MQNDKTLIAAVVVLLAALAPFAGFDVAPEEHQALVEGGAAAVAGLAGIVATLRAIVLRAQAREAGEE
jgi:hypothetical protein